SELHKIGRALAGKGAEDDEAWFDACVNVADEVRGHSERFAAAGHPVSAAAFYLRACHYYQMGERFRTPKNKTALDVYRTAVDCFHRFAALTDVKIEIVEVPFEGKSLPGYFVHAQNATSARAPCVVFFDGLDVTKEIQYLAGVPELIKRGISVLVMDGPGTGEAIRFRGLVLRHDYEKAGSACIDFLEKRDAVAGRKIGIVAISLGGYYAPRCAALEPRFAACIAWGAIWDYHAVWKRRIEAQFKASLSVPGHHIMWILGAATLEDALKRLEPFKLDGVVPKNRRPFLVGPARMTSKFRSPMRRRSTRRADRRTRRYACSRARKAAHSTASATISRSAARPCGVGSRTSSFARNLRLAELNSRDDDGLTLCLEAHLQPARASKKPRVERLNGVRVDGSILGSALQQGSYAVRNAGIEPGGGDAEPHVLYLSDRLHGQRAAARDRLARNDQQVEQ